MLISQNNFGYFYLWDEEGEKVIDFIPFSFFLPLILVDFDMWAVLLSKLIDSRRQIRNHFALADFAVRCFPWCFWTLLSLRKNWLSSLGKAPKEGIPSRLVSLVQITIRNKNTNTNASDIYISITQLYVFESLLLSTVGFI